MRLMSTTLTALTLVFSLAALLPATARSQTASDVACNKCVDAKDIANKAVVTRTIAKGAVTGNRIAPGAVNAARLADGAVTPAKLAAGAAGTPKLADGAVGPGKLAGGAVGTDKLADGAVGAAQLAPGSVPGAAGPLTADKLADGSIDAPQIAPNAVTAAAIAAGAVTGDKLADDAVTTENLAIGAVTTTQLGNAAVGGGKIVDEALTLDKLAARALDATVSFARTIVVSPLGSSAQENCLELRSALGMTADASPNKRYVLKVEPGIYDCGAPTLQMRSFVDIEGSGEGVTVITGQNPSFEGVVRGIDDAELRFLSVENTGGGTFVTGVRAEGNFRMRNVTVNAENGTSQVAAVRTFATANGDPLLIDVTATATGTVPTSNGVVAGVFAVGAPTLVNVFASGTGTGGSGRRALFPRSDRHCHGKKLVLPR